MLRIDYECSAFFYYGLLRKIFFKFRLQPYKIKHVKYYLRYFDVCNNISIKFNKSLLFLVYTDLELKSLYFNLYL